MASKLPQYLRTYRRRFGLTQKEMAHLLGCKSEAKVSRYENSGRLPPLKTALMYEAIFGVPVSKLFAGIYSQVEKETAKHAKTLMQKLEKPDPHRKATRKADLLRAVAVTPEINKENL